jgi:hypothetical protein
MTKATLSCPSRSKLFEEYDRTLLLVKTLCRGVKPLTPEYSLSQAILTLIFELEEKLRLKYREYELSDLLLYESLKKKKKHYKAMAKRMKAEL